MLKETADQHASGKLGDLVELNGEVLELLENLGQGGMGVVYKAHQSHLERIVAVKMLHRHVYQCAAAVDRLHKEAKATAALIHPNIVRIYSVGMTQESRPFLILEFVEGKTVADLMADNGGSLTIEQSLPIMKEVLTALSFAHSSGFVHRDLKPSNIMVTTTGHAKLMDFGIAKALHREHQELTAAGDLLGSPSYMSPEQCRGETLDGRADIYSMGCVLYEMLTGQPLFSGSSALEVMYKHINEPPEFSANLSSPQVRAAIANAVAKHPDDRYSDAADFLETIELSIKPHISLISVAPTAANNSVRMRAQKRHKRNSMTVLLWLTSFLVGCTACFGLYFWQQQRQSKQGAQSSLPGNPRSLQEARDLACRKLQHISTSHWPSIVAKEQAIGKVCAELSAAREKLGPAASEFERNKTAQVLAAHLDACSLSDAKKVSLDFLHTTEKLFGGKETAEYSEALVQLAGLCSRHNQQDAARDYLLQALQIRKKLGSHNLCGDIYEGLAHEKYEQKDIKQTMALLDKALDEYRLAITPDPVRLYTVQQFQIICLSNTGKYNEAMDLLKTCSVAFDKAIANQKQNLNANYLRFREQEIRMGLAYKLNDPATEQDAFDKSFTLACTNGVEERRMRLLVGHARNLFALQPGSLNPCLEALEKAIAYGLEKKVVTPAQVDSARTALRKVKPTDPRTISGSHFGNACNKLMVTVPHT